METYTKNLDQPLVSILMLTYNRAHFLNEAILSVINQTYQNWELIIIDDGSNDQTQAVIGGLTDQRIKYLRHENNVGLFARRKESLTYATGKFIAILDSDDFWVSPLKLAEQVKFFQNNLDHVVVGTFINIIGESGNLIGNKTYAITDKNIRNKILISNQFTHSSLMFRTDAVRKTLGYQPTLAEDLELVLQLGKFGKLTNLPFFYTAHRVHNKSENDRGIKMASAVRNIIQTHGHNYPHAKLASVIGFLRFSYGYLKSLLR